MWHLIHYLWVTFIHEDCPVNPMKSVVPVSRVSQILQRTALQGKFTWSPLCKHRKMCLVLFVSAIWNVWLTSLEIGDVGQLKAESPYFMLLLIDWGSVNAEGLNQVVQGPECHFVTASSQRQPLLSDFLHPNAWNYHHLAKSGRLRVTRSRRKVILYMSKSF